MKAGLDARRRRALRLAWWRYRRPGLLVLTALGVLVAYRIAAPGGPAMTEVAVAARELPAGAVVAAGDVRAVRWPEAALPGGVLPGGVVAPVGRTLAGPLHAGEAFTDTRVVGRSLLAGQPSGTVAVAVRLADAAGAAIVRAGDRVDLLASGAGGSVSGYGGAAERVVSGALVLSAPAGPDGEGSGGDGGGLLGMAPVEAGPGAGPVLVLAVDAAGAQRVASAQGDRLLSAALLAGNTPPTSAITATPATPGGVTLGGDPSG